MKKIYIISAMLLLLSSITSHAQPSVIYGLAKKSGTVKEVHFASVDPATGNVTIISPNYITNHIALSGTAFDFYNNLYFYYSPGGAGINLNAVDISSGVLSYFTTITLPLGSYFESIQFNCNDSSFYGIYRNSITYDVRLGKLNVNSGAATILSPVSLGASAVMDSYTYDKSNQVFYFSNGQNIIGVSMVSGIVISTTPITLSAGEYFENVEFNCNDSTLYGTYRNSSGMKFAKINLTTGIVTVISASSFAGGYIMGGGHILNEDERKYYFNTGTEIFTIDITTGITINSAIYVFPLTGNFYFYYIKKVLDCDCVNPTGAEEIGYSQHDLFYPNPVNRTITFSLNSNKKVSIINLTGETVLQKIFSSEPNQKAEIDVSSLDPGIYFMKVGNKVIRFVKE
ncbi:MAG: T9SS type A sorting domain-containing protein [Bacteroidia bacterium]